MQIGNMVNENHRFGKEILKGLKLEVLSIFLIFFSLLDEQKRDANLYLKLIEYLTTNFYLLLTLIKKLL